MQSSITKEQAPSEIADGFYQIILPDKTNYIFRIKTQEQEPYRQVIAKARRFGSRTFSSFGYVEDGHLYQQGRWKDQAFNDAVIAAATLLLTGNALEAAQLYARTFGRCYVCNRPLTDPHSRDTGIGPDCAGTRKHVELSAGE